MDSFKCYKEREEGMLCWPVVKVVAILASAFPAQANPGNCKKMILVNNWRIRKEGRRKIIQVKGVGRELSIKLELYFL